MPRRPNIEPSVELCLCLPLSERGRLDTHLFSQAEGRVPRGAYQNLFRMLLRDYLDKVEQSNERPTTV